MKFLATVLGLASAANAHTLFTTLYIDGENQGDGTCVRQPKDAAKANSPIYPITGDVMACGRNGDKAVQYICPAPGGAQLTFQFRESPSYSKPGVIAEGHKGPCSVYVKKVDDMYSDSAAGDGWFKIWEDGYNVEEGTWCVDRLRDNDGLLSVDLPTGLPSGYYLVRPEVLALHSAPEGDPQFYTSCAQIFIENGPEGPLEIPEKYQASIPGYVNKDTAGLTYNIYNDKKGKYPIHGPEVWIPTSKETGTKQAQKDGIIPKDCLAKNANWCGKPIAKYSGQDKCWAATKECWDRVGDCWDNAPPTGGSGCDTWNDYCKEMNSACKSGDFEGPPSFTGKEVYADMPGPIPAPYGDFKGSDLSKDGNNSNSNNRVPTKTTKTTKTKPTKPAGNDTDKERTLYKETPVDYTKPAKETKGVKKDTDKERTLYKETPIDYTKPAKQTKAAGVDSDKENTLYKDTPIVWDDKPAPTNTPSKEESSGLKVSEDGRCGGKTGQTCEGSKFGNCCSPKGQCGSRSRHCECGCQKAFGICKK
ncbi:hypothetical protein F66182_3203 [Fusarium sp. NRRL 66182]|nr:hypothetical protein F66182_3203 [Fusarium sp. NRRL 66182]